MKQSGVEWIGKIPEDWKVYRNKNAFICNKEIVGKNSNSTQLLSLTTGGIKCKDINNAEGKLPESFDTYQYVKKNDVVMCLFDLDMSAVFSGISQYDGMISPAYKVLSCQDRANPLFVHYWFSYIFDGRKFNHYAKNIRYTLNYDEFATLPILLPPKETQQRIATYLDKKCSKIEETIQKQQQVIEKLKAYKQSLITEAVTGKKYHENCHTDSILLTQNPNEDMKTEIPLGISNPCGNIEFKYCNLGFIADFKNGLNYNTSDFGTEVKFLGVGDFQNYLVLNDESMFSNIITDTEIEDDYYLKNGDIIFVRSNGSKELVGRAIMVDNIDFKVTYSGFCIRLRNKEPKKINSKFLLYFFRSDYFRNELQRLSQGSNIANINQDLLSHIKIPLVDIRFQESVVDFLNKKCTAIDTVIKQKQNLIEKLTEYKKSLIYECVTGKKEI